MGRLLGSKALLTAALALGLTWWIAGRQGIADSPTPPPDPGTGSVVPEPITGTPSWPDPGFESGPMHPFEPEAANPSDVQLDDLTPEEQVVVEAGAAATGWDTIHGGYHSASVLAAERARSMEAAHDMGLDGLEGLGVP